MRKAPPKVTVPVVHVLLRKRWWIPGWHEIKRFDILQLALIERQALVLGGRCRLKNIAIASIVKG